MPAIRHVLPKQKTRRTNCTTDLTRLSGSWSRADQSRLTLEELCCREVTGRASPGRTEDICGRSRVQRTCCLLALRDNIPRHHCFRQPQRCFSNPPLLRRTKPCTPC